MSAGEILALGLLCLLLPCEAKVIIVSGFNPQMTTKSVAFWTNVSSEWGPTTYEHLSTLVLYLKYKLKYAYGKIYLSNNFHMSLYVWIVFVPT